MANPTHVKLIQQGVTAWNRWRRAHPQEWPNFREASFYNKSLVGADLHSANLRKAELCEANLRGANLRNADLRGAHCYLVDTVHWIGAEYSLRAVRADFREADLSGVDLTRADLRGADLRGADLRKAYLRGANLSEAKITGAKLYGTDRDDWIIEGIVCQYVFFDSSGIERTPKNRNFEADEFADSWK